MIKLLFQWLSPILLVLQVPWYFVFTILLLPMLFLYFLFMPIEYFWGDNWFINQISRLFDLRIHITYAPTILAEYLLGKTS